MKTAKGKKMLEKKQASKKAAEIQAERDLLKLQQEYKRALLSRLYKGAELIEMRSQLETNNITMQWYGIPFPIPILALEHDITQQLYDQHLMEENYIKQALRSKEFRKEHFDKIAKTGEYLKEAPPKKGEM